MTDKYTKAFHRIYPNKAPFMKQAQKIIKAAEQEIQSLENQLSRVKSEKAKIASDAGWQADNFRQEREIAYAKSGCYK